MKATFLMVLTAIFLLTCCQTKTGVNTQDNSDTLITEEVIVVAPVELTIVTDTAGFLKSLDSMISVIDVVHTLKIEGFYHEARTTGYWGFDHDLKLISYSTDWGAEALAGTDNYKFNGAKLVSIKSKETEGDSFETITLMHSDFNKYVYRGAKIRNEYDHNWEDKTRKLAHKSIKFLGKEDLAKYEQFMLKSIKKSLLRIQQLSGTEVKDDYQDIIKVVYEKDDPDKIMDEETVVYSTDSILFSAIINNKIRL